MKHHNSFKWGAARTCKRRQYRSIPLLVFLLVACFRTTCLSQTLVDKPLADSTLPNQILNRTNQLRAIVPVAEQFKDQREQVLSALAELEATARDGQVYLALYRLQSLWTSIQPAEYTRSRADVAKQGLPAFEQSWRRLSTSLKPLEASINKSLPPRLPMAIRGLIQICLTKSQAYYESSRPFGEDVQVKAGLYYMGVASAELDFASMCLRQNFAGQPSSPPFHSLGSALQQLDNNIVDLYKQRDSPQLVEEFIALSSSMEFANQLERARRYDGALIAYLDTVLKLGLLEMAAPPPDALAVLRDRLETFASRLADAGRDNSVGLIYYAMAGRALSHGAAAPQSAGDLKKATALVDRVLPAYFKTALETNK